MLGTGAVMLTYRIETTSTVSLHASVSTQVQPVHICQVWHWCYGADLQHADRIDRQLVYVAGRSIQASGPLRGELLPFHMSRDIALAATVDMQRLPL